MNHLPTVLLVEDNHTDAMLFCLAVKKSPLRVQTRVVHDGHDAVRYLKGDGIFGNRKNYPLPGLVVLDLHMPGLCGLGVLRWIRKQRWLAGLPVVIFTGTDQERSLEEALESGADTYLLKGHDTEGLLTLLQNADLNWNNSDGEIENVFAPHSHTA
jgi:CheY-like chemotaxis protein